MLQCFMIMVLVPKYGTVKKVSETGGKIPKECIDINNDATRHVHAKIKCRNGRSNVQVYRRSTESR